jgi:hypothetical protein
MLDRHGVRIAAVSYDSQEILSGFAEKHRIQYPLLSDRDSAVIRSFGILNINIAPGLRAHGVPHPVDYLAAPDGILIRKYFVANYMHRVTASTVVLREFGVVSENAARVTLRSGALSAEIGLSTSKAFAGQHISFIAKFKLDPGWHVYGAPLPEAYTAASITFDDPQIIGQSFELPEAQPMKIAALGETLPVYGGSFEGQGSLLLKFPLDAGRIVLEGKFHFQQCSDSVCEAPETVLFELPLNIEPFLVATPKK